MALNRIYTAYCLQPKIKKSKGRDGNNAIITLARWVCVSDLEICINSRIGVAKLRNLNILLHCDSEIVVGVTLKGGFSWKKKKKSHVKNLNDLRKCSYQTIWIEWEFWQIRLIVCIECPHYFGWSKLVDFVESSPMSCMQVEISFVANRSTVVHLVKWWSGEEVVNDAVQIPRMLESNKSLSNSLA